MIRVEYCQNCDQHSWCTHHDQFKYQQVFKDIQSALVSHFPQLQIQANVPPPHYQPVHIYEKKYFDTVLKKYVIFPDIGSFEIILDDHLIFSKKRTNSWPKTEELLISIGSILNGTIHEESQNEEEINSQRETLIEADHYLTKYQSQKNFDKQKGQVNFTLTDHFKYYKMKKTIELDKIHSLYAENENLKNKKTSGLTSSEIEKLHQLWGKKQKLPKFIADKAYIQEMKGKKQMILNLQSIEEENELNATGKQSKYSTSAIDLQFNKLESKFNCFQKKYKEVNKIKNQFEEGHIPLELHNKNEKIPPIYSAQKTKQDFYKKKQVLKGLKSKKCKKIQQYILYSQQEKNQLLQQIYGPHDIKKMIQIQVGKTVSKKKKHEHAQNSQQKCLTKEQNSSSEEDSMIQYPHYLNEIKKSRDSSNSKNNTQNRFNSKQENFRKRQSSNLSNTRGSIAQQTKSQSNFGKKSSHDERLSQDKQRNFHIKKFSQNKQENKTNLDKFRKMPGECKLLDSKKNFIQKKLKKLGGNSGEVKKMKSLLISEHEEKACSTTQFNKRKPLQRSDNKQTRGIKRKYRKISNEKKQDISQQSTRNRNQSNRPKNKVNSSSKHSISKAREVKLSEKLKKSHSSFREKKQHSKLKSSKIEEKQKNIRKTKKSEKIQKNEKPQKSQKVFKNIKISGKENKKQQKKKRQQSSHKNNQSRVKTKKKQRKQKGKLASDKKKQKLSANRSQSSEIEKLSSSSEESIDLILGSSKQYTDKPDMCSKGIQKSQTPQNEKNIDKKTNQKQPSPFKIKQPISKRQGVEIARITKQIYGQQNQQQLQPSSTKRENKLKEAGKQWRHLDEILVGEKVLFGYNSIKPQLMIRTSSGQENLMKIIKILCERNQFLIVRLFQNSSNYKINKKKFGVWLCERHKWKRISISYLFPMNPDGQPAFLLHQEKQLWPMVLEKALATTYGGYNELRKVSICDLYHRLTGSNFLSLRIKEDLSKSSTFLKHICENQKKNFILFTTKRSAHSIQEEFNDKKECSVFYVLSQQKLQDKEVIVKMKTGSSDPFWVKLEKFVQEFSELNILYLRINHNFTSLEMPSIKPSNFMIVQMDVPQVSFGAITLSSSQNSGNLRIFLYKSEGEGVLKLIGSAKQKQKSSVFFDCYFSSLSYFLFIECPPNSRLSYFGENKPTFKIKQTIDLNNLKNDYTEYVPVDNVKKKSQISMPSFLAPNMSIMKASNCFMEERQSRSEFQKTNIKNQFINYLMSN